MFEQICLGGKAKPFVLPLTTVASPGLLIFVLRHNSQLKSILQICSMELSEG